MRPTTPAFAVIDGTLFQLTREGAVARSCAPLATAIEEFLCGPLCVFVRERPHGLLPGISNLYKLDAALRLEWLAAWPGEYGACTQIIEIVNDVLIAASALLVHWGVNAWWLLVLGTPLALYATVKRAAK